MAEISEAISLVEAAAGELRQETGQEFNPFLELITCTTEFVKSMEMCATAAHAMGDRDKLWDYTQKLSPISKKTFLVNAYNCLCCIQESLKCGLYKEFSRNSLTKILKFPFSTYKEFLEAFNAQISTETSPEIADKIKHYTGGVLFQLEWSSPIVIFVGKTCSGKTRKQRELINSHLNMHHQVQLFDPHYSPIVGDLPESDSLKIWKQSNFDQGLFHLIADIKSRTSDSPHIHVAIDEVAQANFVAAPSLWKEFWNLVPTVAAKANVSVSLCVHSITLENLNGWGISYLYKGIKQGRNDFGKNVKVVELSK